MGYISVDGYDISMCNSMGGISMDGYDISMCNSMGGISMDMISPCVILWEVVLWI